MKTCNAELMKELKMISSEIDNIVKKAENNRVVDYYEGKEVIRNFDYEAFKKELFELKAEERKIKALLAYSNATTKLIGMEELTISEGLIKLAQLNNTLKVIADFRAQERISRTLAYSSSDGNASLVRVIEHLYDIEQVEKDIKDLQREISRLQLAIDRTNLINVIEY